MAFVEEHCQLQCLLEDTVLFYPELILLSPPGGGQRGGAQAEVREALQWGDRNPAEGRSQLYDRP